MALMYCLAYACMQTFAIPGTLSLSLLAGALYGTIPGLLLVSGESFCHIQRQQHYTYIYHDNDAATSTALLIQRILDGTADGNPTATIVGVSDCVCFSGTLQSELHILTSLTLSLHARAAVLVAVPLHIKTLNAIVLQWMQ